MCSVTFVPRQSGFLLAMNRDEQRARPLGLPPRVYGRGLVLYPSEPGGGTWIGVNRHGVALALINWYSQPWQPAPDVIATSRGMLIPQLLEKSVGTDAAMDNMTRAWSHIDFRRCRPFRLLAFHLQERAVREWRWGGDILLSQKHIWRTQSWFSSGHDEPAAQASRQVVADAAWRGGSGETLNRLRALHASHLPEAGPLSFCMHRHDACTVSYTELEMTTEIARMRYFGGSPCECSAADTGLMRTSNRGEFSVVHELRLLREPAALP